MAIIPLNVNTPNAASPQAAPESAPTPNIVPLDIKSNVTSLDTKKPTEEPNGWSLPKVDKDRIYANAQAAYAGAMTFGSTLAKISERVDKGMHKLTSKITGLEVPDKGPFSLSGVGEQAQRAYESANETYQKNREKYPELPVAHFLGELGSEGPLASGHLGTTAVNLGRKLGGATGELVGTMASGGAIGSTIGGLSNTPGQDPNQIVNPNGALIGATLGSTLSPVAGMLIPKWGEAVARYQMGKDALRSAGYQGPILSRDFTTDGWVKDVKNKMMDNIPFVTAATRGQQIKGVQDAVKQWVTKLSDDTVNGTKEQIGNIINNTRNQMQKTNDQLWGGLFQDAKNAGINKVPLSDEVKGMANNIASKYQNELSTYDMNKLISPMTNIRDASLDYLHQLKRDVWPVYVKAAKKEGTGYENLANDLRSLYWKLNDNVSSAFANHPQLDTAYKGAREYTSNMMNIFDPKNDRALANAINDVNQTGANLSTFVNSILKPKSPGVTDRYNKIFGPEYQKSTESLALQTALDKATNKATGEVNLSSFFKDMGQSASGRLLGQNTLQAVQGLQQYTQAISGAQQTAANSSMRNIQTTVPVALAGAGAATLAGASPMPAAMVGGTIASAASLGFISRHSPLKNALIYLSNVWGKNPQITEKLVEEIGRKSLPAGITFSTDESGNVKIDHTPPKSKNTTKPKTVPLSLNSSNEVPL